MDRPVRVIVVTDGDKVARRTLERAAASLNLRCISASAGNPTPLMGPEIVALIRQALYDPVLVMVDDKGYAGHGCGEEALAYIANSPDVEVIGAIAVASDTRHTGGVEVDISITREGALIPGPVDKAGRPSHQRHGRLEGDTVSVLRQIPVPVIVGIGDIGKMEGADCLQNGAWITTRAIMEVLDRWASRLPVPPDPRPSPGQPQIY